jgi:HSP20 family protein
MATQTTKSSEQNQETQGQAMARESQQQAGSSRRTGYALGMPLAPVDLFRMSPFSLMRRMTEELDRVLAESTGREPGEKLWAPAIDVTQREGSYVVRAELPGLNPEDVKLEITDDAIVIQGERKIEHEEAKGGIHVTERRYGRFYRAIPLPEGAKVSEARARFENGVLEVTVPTEEQRSQTREIPIQGSSSGATEGSAGKSGGSSGATEGSAGKSGGSSGSAGGSNRAG